MWGYQMFAPDGISKTPRLIPTPLKFSPNFSQAFATPSRLPSIYTINSWIGDGVKHVYVDRVCSKIFISEYLDRHRLLF